MIWFLNNARDGIVSSYQINPFFTVARPWRQTNSTRAYFGMHLTIYFARLLLWRFSHFWNSATSNFPSSHGFYFRIAVQTEQGQLICWTFQKVCDQKYPYHSFFTNLEHCDLTCSFLDRVALSNFWCGSSQAGSVLPTNDQRWRKAPRESQHQRKTHFRFYSSCRFLPLWARWNSRSWFSLAYIGNSNLAVNAVPVNIVKKVT